MLRLFIAVSYPFCWVPTVCGSKVSFESEVKFQKCPEIVLKFEIVQRIY